MVIPIVTVWNRGTVTLVGLLPCPGGKVREAAWMGIPLSTQS